MRKNNSDEAYRLMLETYKGMHINTVDRAYQERTHIRKKAWLFTLFILGLCAALAIIFTQLIVFWVMLGLFATIWVWLSARYGFRLIDRYIVEELQGK